MSFSFLTPLGGLAGLVAVVFLAAVLVRERRSRRIRTALGLRAPGLRAHLPSALALVTLALLALAAAQPAVHATDARLTRTDAEVFFLFDTSRSMLASASLTEPTRFTRAVDLSLRLRDALAEVPAGVATVTDRALPHLMATPDDAAFADVVLRSIAVDRPPPFGDEAVATDLAVIRFLASDSFFTMDTRRRLVILLTDGESQEFDAEDIAEDLRENGDVRLITVHVWGAEERIYRPDGRTERYRPDERSRRDMAGLARATRGSVHAERDEDAIVTAARRVLGEGREAQIGTEERRIHLAPYFVLAAAVPLALLLASVTATRRRFVVAPRREAVAEPRADGVTERAEGARPRFSFREPAGRR